MACEKCWRQASVASYWRGGSVVDHYARLLKENDCDAEEQQFGCHRCRGCAQPEDMCSCEEAEIKE